MRTHVLLLCGVVMVSMLRPANGQGPGTLGEAIDDLARDVKTYLDSVGKRRVAVGQIPGTGDMARSSSAGPLLQTALERRLKELGVELVSRKADFELRGEFMEKEDVDSKRQFVLIKLELRDQEGKSRYFEGIETLNGRTRVTKYFVK